MAPETVPEPLINEGRGCFQHPSIIHTYPWIFPLVGHGDDVSVEEVTPISRCIPAIVAFLWWWDHLWITFQPRLYHIMVELLRPQQTCSYHGYSVLVHQETEWEALIKYEVKAYHMLDSVQIEAIKLPYYVIPQGRTKGSLPA